MTSVSRLLAPQRNTLRQLVTLFVSARGPEVLQSLQIPQWADKFLVISPALHGVLVYFLPNLPEAGGRHLTFRLVEVENPLIPFETQAIQDFARPSLLISDQFLVRYVQHCSRRKDGTPMRHESPVLAVVVRQVRQIHREIQGYNELLKITRQARVNRVTLHVNNPSVWES